MDSADYVDGCKCKLGKSDSSAKLKLMYNYDDTVSNRSLVGFTHESSLTSLFTNSSMKKVFMQSDEAKDRANTADGEAKDRASTVDEPSSEEEPCTVNMAEKDELVPTPSSVSSFRDSKKDSSSMSLRPELQLHTTNRTPEENSDSSSSDTCRKDVSARCGKPLPCSVRNSSLPDGQISLAVFLKLPNCLSLANKYRNVFIRCSYHYVNNGLDTLSTQFVNVRAWGVIEAQGGETEFIPIMSIGEGKMFNCCLVIPLPMHNEDVFCVGASGGDEDQTTPTSHLQAFLTRHSSFKEKGTSIADIVLQFEGVGTNDSNNFEYMKNRVGAWARAERQNNRILFTEMVSFNTLLSQTNTLMVLQGEKVPVVVAPRVRAPSKAPSPLVRANEFSFNQLSHSLSIPSSMNTQKPGSPPKPPPALYKSLPRISPSPIPGSQQPSVSPEGSPTTDAEPAGNDRSTRQSVDTEFSSFDFDRIPDVATTDRYASCPSTVPMLPIQITSASNHHSDPNSTSGRLPEAVGASNRLSESANTSNRLSETLNTPNHLPDVCGTPSRLSESTNTPSHLPDFSYDFYLDKSPTKKRESLEGDWTLGQSYDIYSLFLAPPLTPRSTPVGNADNHHLAHGSSVSYVFGVCLVSIRPRTEGRFFKKEYVFDKQNANGRAVFLTEGGKCAHGVYLTHITEMMNETESESAQLAHT